MFWIQPQDTEDWTDGNQNLQDVSMKLNSVRPLKALTWVPSTKWKSNKGSRAYNPFNFSGHFKKAKSIWQKMGWNLCRNPFKFSGHSKENLLSPIQWVAASWDESQSLHFFRAFQEYRAGEDEEFICVAIPSTFQGISRNIKPTLSIKQKLTGRNPFTF